MRFIVANNEKVKKYLFNSTIRLFTIIEKEFGEFPTGSFSGKWMLLA
jgi:hypothetical protein